MMIYYTLDSKQLRMDLEPGSVDLDVGGQYLNADSSCLAVNVVRVVLQVGDGQPLLLSGHTTKQHGTVAHGLNTSQQLRSM